METPPVREAAIVRWLGAIDARFRKSLPEYDNEPISLAQTFRDAGALRWLILFQALIYWASVTFSPLLAPDNDLFFHLAHGRYQELTGRVPTDAYFSFLEPRAYVDYYWLFQRLVFELWQAAGPLGLILLRAAAITLALGVLGLFLFGRRRSGAGLLSAILVFSLVGSRLVEVLTYSRPFVYSYLCLLLMLWVLEMRSRWVPLLPLIGVLWINLHGVEHPVMLAVVLAYAGDEILAWARRRELPAASRRRLLWLLLTLPVLVISPLGFGLVLFPFKSTALASLYVAEMQRPTFESLFTVAFGPEVARPLFGSTAILFLLGLAALARSLQKRQLRPAHLVLMAAGCYLVLHGYRFTIEFALLLLPLLAQGIFPERRSYRPPLATVLVAALAGLLCYEVARTWIRDSRGSYPLAFNDFPYGVSSFLAKVAPPGGRVYNTANFGGFLLWQLGDRHKIMMDMELQAIFRDDDFFLNRISMIDAQAFKVFVEAYRPDWLAISHDVARAATFLHGSEDFVPVAFDDSLVLLVDRRRHPELAEQWRLRALDPWRAKIDAEYRLSPAAAAEGERLYSLEPRGLRLPTLLAQAAIGRGDLAALERYVDTLIEVSPDNADSWNLLSVLQLQRGDLEGAAAALEKAVLRAQPPVVNRMRGPLAHFLARLGERRGALEQLRLRGPFYDPIPLEDLELEVELLEELGPPAEAAAARRLLALRRGERAF